MPQTTTLIATARNEGPFLLEWVAYHRAIGFDHIVILSDTSHDGTETLLEKLSTTRTITHIPKEAQTQIADKGFRNRAYAHALTLDVVIDADWVMVLDIDEYLNIHVGNGKLDDLFTAMDKHGPTDVISPSWRIFGNAGQAGFINRLLLPRFTRAAPRDTVLSDKHLGIKSMFRPGPVTRIGPHRPRLNSAHINGQIKTMWRNGAGADVTEHLLENGWSLPQAARGDTLAQINHYVIRSNAVFALHHLHTPALTGDQSPMGLADHARFNTNQVADTTITRWAQATTAEIKRLQSFPGVQAAHKDCVSAYQSLIFGMQSKISPDSPIAALLNPDAAKTGLARQLADQTKARHAPEAASDMHMVDPEDMAPDWLADLRRSGHRRGWFYADDTFGVQMTTRSRDVLVVSFDDAPGVDDTSLARNTWGYPVYRDAGWSHMGVMAFDPAWVRDARLFNFLEGQVKTGIFKQFGRVIFTGHAMGGFAATAFASLVPGCTVLAFSPFSTLDQDIVPWETRHDAARALNWSGRYRDAADHCGHAEAAYILHDPYVALDAQHAARYQGDTITHLKSWYMGATNANTPLVKDIMQAVVANTLTPTSYYQMYRQRRENGWYFARLADHAFDNDHPKLAAALAKSARNHTHSDIADDIEDRL